MDRVELVRIVDELERAVAAWRDTPSPVVPQFAGEITPRTQYFPQGDVDVLDQLRAAVDRDDFDGDIRRIALAADLLLDEARDRKSGAIWGWKAYHDLLSSRQPPEPRPVESPQLLAAQGVSHQQIAKMLQWVDWRGEPDSARVAEELRVPGTHFNASEAVHPLDQRDAEELDRRWSERIQRREAARQQGELAQASTSPATPRRCETVDELLEQGVNVAQICKMTKHTEAEVLARAELLGVNLEALPRPKNGLTAVRRATHEADQRVVQSYRLRTIDTHPEAGGWPARIEAMRADGVSDRDIADTMRLNHGYSLSSAWRLVRPMQSVAM